MERSQFDTAGALRLEPVADLDALRPEWSALAATTDNVFSSWEWNAVWWRHMGVPGRLLAHAARRADGSLAAVFPLFLWRRRPVRVVRLIGCAGGDELGPICAPEDWPAAAGALEACLASVRADLFLGERVPAHNGLPGALGGRVLSVEPSPVVRIESGDWDTYLRSKSRNFRDQVGRRERRLFRERDASFHLTSDPARLDADLDALFALHASRWGEGKTNFQRLEAVHRSFAATALERGWLRLWFLNVDGAPRAACYGFRFGGVECFYQAGRDPAWDEHSVGFVLLAHCIREAVRDGIREYRLLRGGEAYKYRFATDPQDELETFAVSSTLTARAAVTGAVAARKLGLLRTPHV